MKKLLALVSVSVLAACGGGHGGGGNGGHVDYAGHSVTAEQRAAVESNSAVTGMLTYLETDSLGNTVTSRAAANYHPGVQQKAGTYDLSDVKFANIDEGFEDVGDEDGLQFVVDENNKIIGFNVDPWDQLDEDHPARAQAEYADKQVQFLRNQDSNTFTGWIKAEDENGNGQWILGELEYNSLGKMAGLRYSDFGNIAIKELENNTYQQRLAFIGGYDDAKRIETIDEDAEFHGHATGSVVSVLGGPNTGKCLNIDTMQNANDEDKVATFAVNNGTSTLTAKFDNWYDVAYTESGGNKSITFSNYTTSPTVQDVNGVDVDANEFRMRSDNGSDSFTLTPMAYQVYEEGNPVFDAEHNPVMADNLNSEIRYFGDNGTPSEVVGLVQIRDRGTDPENYENINDYNNAQEVRMNLSFGAK